MVWSNNDNWMVTGDHGGFVKYWQSNMNNVKMFQAHKEPIRGIRYFIIYIFLCIYKYLVWMGEGLTSNKDWVVFHLKLKI